MQVLERLKMELSKKKYFLDEEYITFIEENNLNPVAEYSKETMQKQLLFTVVDILEAVGNDVDLMRKVDTEFETTEAAYKHLQARIQDVKKRIATIPDPVDPEANSLFSLMFTR